MLLYFLLDIQSHQLAYFFKKKQTKTLVYSSKKVVISTKQKPTKHYFDKPFIKLAIKNRNISWSLFHYFFH